MNKSGNFLYTNFVSSVLSACLEVFVYLGIIFHAMFKAGTGSGVFLPFTPFVIIIVALRIFLCLALSSVFKIFLTRLVLNSFIGFLSGILFGIAIKTSAGELLDFAKIMATSSALASLIEFYKRHKKIKAIQDQELTNNATRVVLSWYRVSIEVASVQLMIYLTYKIIQNPQYFLGLKNQILDLTTIWSICVLGVSLINFIGYYMPNREYKHGFSFITGFFITVFLVNKFALTSTETFVSGATLAITACLASMKSRSKA